MKKSLFALIYGKGMFILFPLFGALSGLYAQASFDTDSTAALARYGLLTKWLTETEIPLWIVTAVAGFIISIIWYSWTSRFRAPRYKR